MALFSKKETVKKPSKTTKKVATKEVAKKSDTSYTQKDTLKGVIMNARITEKSTHLAGSNVYVFEVSKNASKPIIAKTIKALYSVSPLKIAIVKNPAKRVVVRGNIGKKNAIKKAYVTLKEGDKIEFA